MSDRQIGAVARELIAAKKRIEDSDNWCQGAISTDDGRMCAYGALGMTSIAACVQLLDDAAKALFPDVCERKRSALAPAPWVNDTVGHAAVMAMYDHAIQRAISEGK